MSTIRTYLRFQGKSNIAGIVWISFYVNRDKVAFSTKITCESSSWNEKKSIINASDKDASDKNLIIENIHSRINTVFVRYRLKNKKLTREGFTRAYNRPDDYETFYEFIKDYQKQGACSMNELTTMNVHKVVLKKLEEYAPTLHFDEIDHQFLDRFYVYLRKKLKNNENTAYKNMTTVRKYVRAAWKAGYMDEYAFDNWHIKRTKASYTYLTELEVTKLLELYMSGTLEHKYHKTLELFLFMCFSSLHIGDARLIKLEQFTPESFTYFRIKNKNSKPEAIVVPVSDILKKIIINIVGIRRHGLIFENMPADQTMNEYLKKIAGWAEIGKKISHKAGRHTFATFFLRKTKDITSLKEILGHSDLRETLIYAHVLDESKQEGIMCFNGFELY